MMEPVVERRISQKAFTGPYLASAAVALAAAALCFAAGAGPFSPLALLAPAVVFARSRMALMGSTYRLYPDRLEVESGIVTRKIENVELFRVRDVGLRQGLLGRMTDFGDVYVHSTDSSTPALHLRGIDSPREFYQQLRQAVADNRARGRTLIMEESREMPEP